MCRSSSNVPCCPCRPAGDSAPGPSGRSRPASGRRASSRPLGRVSLPRPPSGPFLSPAGGGWRPPRAGAAGNGGGGGGGGGVGGGGGAAAGAAAGGAMAGPWGAVAVAGVAIVGSIIGGILGKQKKEVQPVRDDAAQRELARLRRELAESRREDRLISITNILPDGTILSQDRMHYEQGRLTRRDAVPRLPKGR